MYNILNPQMSLWPKAIVFDFDGTLVDSLPLIRKAFYYALESVESLPGVSKDMPLPATSLRETFPSLFGKRAQEAEKIFYQYVGDYHLETLEILPGAADLLAFLSAQGIPCSIVSNKKGGLLCKEVDYLGWTGYFSAVIGAGDCEKDKPSPLPVAEALRPLSLEASQDVWFVGDSGVDIDCANKSGCTAIFVQDPGQQPFEKTSLSIDAIIFSCEDLKKMILDNNIKV